MKRHRHSLFGPVVVAVVFLTVAVAGAWTVDLPDSVTVAGDTVRLADVSRNAVPASVATMVVAAGGRPGAAVTITGRAILRRLVMAGLADDVRFSGADRCRITFAGQTLAASDVTNSIHDLLLEHVPDTEAEAPPAWLALEVPAIEVHAAGEWSVIWPNPRTLVPGRNLVTVQLCEGDRRRGISVAAVLHTYARTAVPVSTVPRGQVPVAESMQWVWTDLAQAGAKPVTDPRELAGMRATRDLAPGEMLTRRDLEPEPLVERGDLVDLVVRRGGIAAVVRAECREDGLLGETVSVLNKFNGRPMVARVTGPGVVTLGR